MLRSICPMATAGRVIVWASLHGWVACLWTSVLCRMRSDGGRQGNTVMESLWSATPSSCYTSLLVFRNGGFISHFIQRDKGGWFEPAVLWSEVKCSATYPQVDPCQVSFRKAQHSHFLFMTVDNSTREQSTWPDIERQRGREQMRKKTKVCVWVSMKAWAERPGYAISVSLTETTFSFPFVFVLLALYCAGLCVAVALSCSMLCSISPCYSCVRCCVCDSLQGLLLCSCPPR